jgi:ribosomal protein S18 acetylase RimI-like enzyme
MLLDRVVRRAQPADFPGLSHLLETGPNIHRHLDWRPPLEWLGHDPFWLIEDRGKIVAAMACPADPPGVAWIRLFAVQVGTDLKATWQVLFERVLEYYNNQPGVRLAAIAIYPWFGELLRQMGFRLHQEIVILEWENSLPAPITPIWPVRIRRLELADLPDVTDVDNRAFDPLWQNSLESLRLALQQAAYATVALSEGKIVGYQISTAASFSAHLARLAVLPNLQRKSIGYLLVMDLLKYFSAQDMFRVTVNTQDNNHASLNLYRKMGFWLTGDQFEVYVHV